MKYLKYPAFIATLFLLNGCGSNNQSAPTTQDTAGTQNKTTMFTPIEGDVNLMNLAPGHFHASLVQKTMYKSVSPVVHVYAPKGPEVNNYLNRIGDYNARPENPTSWLEEVYTGTDFLEKMLC